MKSCCLSHDWSRSTAETCRWWRGIYCCPLSRDFCNRYRYTGDFGVKRIVPLRPCVLSARVCVYRRWAVRIWRWSFMSYWVRLRSSTSSVTFTDPRRDSSTWWRSVLIKDQWVSLSILMSLILPNDVFDWLLLNLFNRIYRCWRWFPTEHSPFSQRRTDGFKTFWS